jgi:hypothetical protein
VNGLIFLAPFMIVGALARKTNLLVRLNILHMLVLLAVMSFVFPFAGSRGGFFHSSTALMPVLWALAAVGIDRAVRWAGGKRGWAIQRARSLYGWSAPVLAGVLTLGLFWTRVIGRSPASPAWSAPAEAYTAVAGALEGLNPNGSIVAANNPPGLSLATGAPSVMIPNGSPETLHAAVEKYDVRWVVLDANRPDGLAELYDKPDSLSWLSFARRIERLSGGDILILRVVEGEG